MYSYWVASMLSPSPVSRAWCGQKRDGSVEGGSVVACELSYRIRRRHRVAVFVHVARESLADGIERRTLHIVGDARLAESGYVTDNQFGITLPKHFIGHVQFVELTALGRLDEDVSIFDELKQCLAAHGMPELQCDVAAVASFAFTLPVGGASGKVRHVGVLHPDHIGTVLAENGGDERTR